jgi:hypothetical protein
MSSYYTCSTYKTSTYGTSKKCSSSCCYGNRSTGSCVSNDSTTCNTQVTDYTGVIAGAVVGGAFFIFLVIMIACIIKSRRAAARLAASGIGKARLNDTTIVMTHNQPAYGVSQPIYNPTMEMINQQPFQPMYNQPVYNQPMQPSVGFGYDQFMGGSYQQQQGPVMYH